jgi:hypothetical protein
MKTHTNITVEIKRQYTRFKVLTAVNIKLWDAVWFGTSNILEKAAASIFRVVTPCSLVGRYQHVGGDCCLHHQGL